MNLGREIVAPIRGARLLLVEDNEVNQQVATELLEQAQLVVEIANNGAEAVEMVKAGEYDGVLMDLQMPVMDGMEATRRIREEDKFADLPIIAMTANAMAGDRELCLEAGMNDHVAKPIIPKELYASLAEWVEPGEREVPTDLLSRAGSADSGNQPLPELPGFDLTSALERVGGNVRAYRKLLTRFAETEADAVARIQDALRDGNREAAVRTAHTLKGVAGNIGAADVQALAADLETLLKDEASDDHEPVLLQTEEMLQEAVATVTIALSGPSTELSASDVSFATLASLVERLGSQIDDFNSEASETAAELHSVSLGRAWEEKASALAEALDSYEFEDAETLLEEVRHSIKAEKAPEPDTRQLIDGLTTLLKGVDECDAMAEEMLENLLATSSGLRASTTVESAKRALASYDFIAAHPLIVAVVSDLRDELNREAAS